MRSVADVIEGAALHDGRLRQCSALRSEVDSSKNSYMDTVGANDVNAIQSHQRYGGKAMTRKSIEASTILSTISSKACEKLADL